MMEKQNQGTCLISDPERTDSLGKADYLALSIMFPMISKQTMKKKSVYTYIFIETYRTA